MVCSQVLEHFDDAAEVLRKLSASAAALGLRGMIIVVPGLKGFRRDPTHRTFITEAFIRSQGLDQLAPFRLTRVAYFPGNWRFPLFVLTWLLLWGLNILMIAILLPLVGGNPYVAGAIAMVIVVALSFIVQKYLVFADRPAR